MSVSDKIVWNKVTISGLITFSRKPSEIEQEEPYELTLLAEEQRTKLKNYVDGLRYVESLRQNVKRTIARKNKTKFG